MKSKRERIDQSFRASKLAWYRDRLADPALLDHAVDLGFDIAVPVGGSRRGGFICCDGKGDASHAIAVLRKHDGFPNLTYAPGDDEVMDNVRWGDPEPELPTGNSDLAWARSTIETGRYYGYSDDAIRAFIRKRYPATIAAAAIP